MNRLHVSARLRAATKSAFLVIALSMVSAFVSGCDDSTPTCNNCPGPINPTPVTPGSLPGSTIAVSGDRCGASTSERIVVPNQLLATKLADPTAMSLTFAVNEPFVVYWSVCNIGSSPLPAIATMQGVHIRQTAGTGGPNDTQSWSIPALDGCKCIDPIPQRQFPTGLPAAGTYEVNLIGEFDTLAMITIN